MLCNPLFFVVNTGRYIIANEFLINDQIKEKELRLIGSHGQQIGIVSLSDALRQAEEEELDLVLIAPQAKPPGPQNSSPRAKLVTLFFCISKSPTITFKYCH